MASKSSVRKPLKDLSNNNGRYLKSVNPKKKCKEIGEKNNVNRVQQQDDEDGFLDRLLLVQSDLSSLTSQAHELVAQAFKLKTTSKEGSEEIESFMHVLSNMLSSLKPWVPRFQKALSSHFVEPENKLHHKIVPGEIEDGSFDVDSPDKIRMDSLISPSPLVSWRAGCNVERVFERIALHPAVELPSFSTVSREGNEDLLEEMATKPTPSKPADSVATEGKLDRVSSPVFSKQNHSVVMTPCLKMSPPKSCVLLEPMSQSSHKGDNSEGSEDLAFKYPELLGIQRAYKSRMGIKDLEASPNWSFSPPKTCVVLKPRVEKSLDMNTADHRLKAHAPVLNQQANPTPSKEYGVKGGCHQIKKPCNEEPICSSLKVTIERTPLWKESESTIRTGKRPGENTLKKELWTKFEAASTYGFRLNACEFQGTAKKDFLTCLKKLLVTRESQLLMMEDRFCSLKFQRKSSKEEEEEEGSSYGEKNPLFSE
ncbi:hypothetical protein OIU74_020969 [Salix koriyanagi]|uniref:Uncharacterized protein n=1 Tax=Salix koriyanagi TaxID=2511006 RepID=A0A9Q0P737_9ROSI|nr:hypothetical protein OIU74_020969 [Salix koriyanagi]